MANNRLYIVNIETGEYICLAKAYESWYVSKMPPIEDFIAEEYSGVFGGECPFIFVRETDTDLYKQYIENGTQYVGDGNP